MPKLPGVNHRDVPGGVSMIASELTLAYPLFALKRDANYVGYDFRAGQPPVSVFGIPVFTTDGNVVKFLTATGIQAQIKAFDRVGLFRRFLRSLRDSNKIVMFDPLPDGRGNMHSARVYPAAVVLERFLPEPTWGWDYPVYVLGIAGGFACINGDVRGNASKMLVVFTDSDLADRAVTAAHESVAAVPVESSEAFAHLIRDLSPDVGGAAFDPPDPGRGGVVKTAVLREQLLADLEAEI